jgi:hypothetical protein
MLPVNEKALRNFRVLLVRAPSHIAPPAERAAGRRAAGARRASVRHGALT